MDRVYLCIYCGLHTDFVHVHVLMVLPLQYIHIEWQIGLPQLYRICISFDSEWGFGMCNK